MNIRFLGYFDKNFGDDLMQLTTVKNMPEHDFYICSEPKELLTHFHGCENVHICDENVKTEAYLNVTGTGFKYDSKLGILTKLAGFFSEERLEHNRAAVINCSVDMPGNAVRHMLIKRELNKYGLISCRDKISEKIAADLAKKSVVKQHEDIVFSYGGRNFEKTGEDFLGIVPVRHGHGKNAFNYYSALSEAADGYFESSGKRILIFALDTGEENDFFAASAVLRLMKHKEAAEIIAYNSEPGYIFENISRCGKVISSRFHGIVAAILSGVPVAAVSDASKCIILSEKLGFEVVSVSSLSKETALKLAERTEKPMQLPEDFKADAGRHLAEVKNYFENRRN